MNQNLNSEDHIFYGQHVLGEFYGVSEEKLDDLVLLEKSIRKGIIVSGASLCSLQKKQFDPAGVTLLALLSESHASIHTYPEKKALFFDAFTCGHTCQPMKIAEQLIKDLQPSHHNLQVLERGEDKLSLSRVQSKKVSFMHKKQA